ncbi:hypothetical protein SAMN04488134_10550 [Amphibacillus marinus]|uniref:YwdI family protein n=1 Tax=Amphibacillus marinus TaxID=872970 RepID=A0A1H8MYN0_9BACI|nr:YwdI family protein [Amphibacillus marinus]SEO22348.1 hypothetical protein SAMN04488134_10550 [Amphibacillus marinus]
MFISQDKILKKIANELALAQQTRDEQRMKEHVRAIKLLTDLILDEEVHRIDPQPKTAPQLTTAEQLELQKMMGSYEQSNKPKDIQKEYRNNGSLLDF